MEDEEALETSALVRQLPDSVQDQVDQLLPDGVMAPGVVVGSVFFACNQLLGVEQLFVRATANFVWNP